MQLVTGYHNRSRNKGATLSPASGQVVNLTTPLSITVTKGGEIKTYTLSVIYERSISQKLWDAVNEYSNIVDHQVSYGRKLR